MMVLTATLPDVAQRGTKVPALAYWRKRRLLTQRQLASDASVAQTTIVRAEAGGSIDLATIGRLARALNVAPDTLMGAQAGEG